MILSWILLHLFLWQCHAKVDFRYVTYGSTVKLFNQRQEARLHSHDVKYGSGSGQQSVTGSSSPDDHNSYWVIRGPHGESMPRGDIVKCGDRIRLQHLSTKRNLHSHFFQSPITHQQEVSAFGENGDGDTGDNWIAKCSTKYWNRKNKLRFQHDDTGLYLHISSEKFGRPISGQNEICGKHTEENNNLWIAQEGVYVKENKTAIPKKEEL